MSMNTKEELMKSEFWQKKAAAVVKARDVNKDGLITRADYMIMLKRYKDMGSSKQHLKKLEDYFDTLCMSIGLKDDSVELKPEDVIAQFLKSDLTIEQYVKGFEWETIIIIHVGDLTEKGHSEISDGCKMMVRCTVNLIVSS